MQIRYASKSDYEQIKSLIDSSLEKKVIEYLPPKAIKAIKKYYNFDLISSLESIYVAEDKNKIIGCAGILKNNFAKMLYVTPTYKGVKSAIQLFKQITKDLKNKAYSEMKFESIDSSKNFFQKLGCQIISEKNNQIENTSFKTYLMKYDL